MRLRTALTTLAAATAVLLVATDTFAQAAQARGKVTDEWGNGLEGVQVTAELWGLAQRRSDPGGGTVSGSATTDEDGEFQMNFLTSARYDFTFILDGYQGIRTAFNLIPGRESNNSPIEIELETLPSGGRMRNDTEFEAEGGTPKIKLGGDGMFEFEDAEGEGEGTYGIVELNAVMIVRDYDGPDDKYTVREPVVVTFLSDQFNSLSWGDATLMKK